MRARGSGAPMLIGNILQTMGQEKGKAYLQRLKTQNVAKTTASNRQLLDLVIAGEYPLALHIFNHHAHISKTAGAPVDWWKRAAAHRTERLNHSSNRVGPRRGFSPGAIPRLPITAP